MVKGLNKRALNRLYLKEKKSLHEIALMYSCSIYTVRKMCKGYGIQIRDARRDKGFDRVFRTNYFDIEQLERLKELSTKTKVPQAVYIREGIDLVLNRYSKSKNEKKKIKTVDIPP